MSDTFRVDTPESVDLALEPAGLGSRFLAIMIDALLQWGAVILLLFILIPTTALGGALESFNMKMMNGVLVAILLSLVGFLFFGYKLLLEAFWNGQTVGKRIVGIRVIKANGLPVDFVQVLVRNLLRVADYLPLQYLVGSVSIVVSERGQRLGDIVAGTVVVRDRREAPPVIPVELTHQPAYDLSLLREHVLRLSDVELEAARRFWVRRWQLAPQHRWRVGVRIAEGLAARMQWQEPPPPHPEMFIETVLYMRAM